MAYARTVKRPHRQNMKRILRTAIRAVLLVLLIVVGIFLTMLVVFFAQGYPSAWAKQMWSRWTCQIMGIKIELRGRLPSRAQLLLSNHISFLDVLVLAALQPSFFLSKSEVAKWPLIGWLARKNGTLFITRGQGTEQAVKDIAERLKVGSTIAFFPEATTTDGKKIRRYYPHIMEAAVQANIIAQPVLLAYVVKDETTGGWVCDEDMAYVEDRSMARIIFDMLGNSRTQTIVTVLEPLSPEKYTPKAMAKLAHASTAEAQSLLYQHKYDELAVEKAEIERGRS